MAEPNILLTRIDNRLIHGQVATQWTSTIGANLILVANDDVAGNKMRQKLMDMAAPQGVATRYFSVAEHLGLSPTIAACPGRPAAPGARNQIRHMCVAGSMATGGAGTLDACSRLFSGR